MVIAVIGTAFRRYESLMPLAGNCSAVISAACHRLPEDVNAATRPVTWGVVSEKDGVAHCAFSSLEVLPPLDGQCLA